MATSTMWMRGGRRRLYWRTCLWKREREREKVESGSRSSHIKNLLLPVQFDWHFLFHWYQWWAGRSLPHPQPPRSVSSFSLGLGGNSRHSESLCTQTRLLAPYRCGSDNESKVERSDCWDRHQRGTLPSEGGGGVEGKGEGGREEKGGGERRRQE